MKRIRRLFSAILFSALASIGYSQEFQIRSMELVTTFPAGRGNGELGNNMSHPDENGPMALAFDSQGLLYVSDFVNQRLVQFDSDFGFVRNVGNSLAGRAINLRIRPNNDFEIYGPRAFGIEREDNAPKFAIFLRETPYASKLSSIPKAIYFANYVFIPLNDRTLLVYRDPGPDYRENNNYTRLIPPGSTDPLTGQIAQDILASGEAETFEIDEHNRIIVDGRIRTQDYLDFVTFWIEQRQRQGTVDRSHFDGFTDAYLSSGNIRSLVGSDSERNTYWWYPGSLLIMDASGYLIHALRYDTDLTRRAPTIHPSGDIYFIDYDGNRNYLRRITRTW